MKNNLMLICDCLLTLGFGVAIVVTALSVYFPWKTELAQTDDHTANTIFTGLVWAFLLFTVWGKWTAQQRNLPTTEDLPDSDYHILQKFHANGKKYYLVEPVVGESGKSVLIESSIVLPPDETRSLPRGAFQNQARHADRFEISRGIAYPLYGSPA